MIYQMYDFTYAWCVNTTVSMGDIGHSDMGLVPQGNLIQTKILSGIYI